MLSRMEGCGCGESAAALREGATSLLLSDCDCTAHFLTSTTPPAHLSYSSSREVTHASASAPALPTSLHMTAPLRWRSVARLLPCCLARRPVAARPLCRPLTTYRSSIPARPVRAFSTVISSTSPASAAPTPASPPPRPPETSTPPTSSSTAPPARVCIVGSGPAGMYTAKYLLRDYPNILLDMSALPPHLLAVSLPSSPLPPFSHPLRSPSPVSFEQLPVPFGLVRFGVAPDHPEVKQVQHDFQQTLDDPRVRFFGHVSVGSPALPLSSLLSAYHATVLAYGASSSRRIDVPGSHLHGISPARRFVDWYNGHPSTPQAPVEVRGPQVVVVGQGNVAIDCARLLLKGRQGMATTDVSNDALSAMDSAQWRDVHQVTLLGRRGPVQAAFTIAEFREVTHLPGIRVDLNPDEVAVGDEPASQREAADSRPKKRKFALVKEVAGKVGQGEDGGSKVLAFRFCLAPVEYVEDPARPGWVGGVRAERMRLVAGKGDGVKAEPMGEYETLPAQMVLESIGYMSVPVPGLPFDTVKAVVPQVRGRVLAGGVGEGAGEGKGTGFVDGLYVAGWLKRGPTGIIGSNIADARETVASVVEGLKAGEGAREEREGADLESVQEAGGGMVVDKEGWKRIDEWERSQGEAQGRGRVKLVAVEQMLDIARARQ